MLDGEMVRWCHHNIPMPLKLGIVAALPSPPSFLLSLNGKYFLNPFNAVNDQERISPCNISTISSRQVMRIQKNINQGILSRSSTSFSSTNIIRIVRETLRRVTDEITEINEIITFIRPLGPEGTRAISSNSSFLFSIKNAFGLKPFKVNVKENHKQAAALNDPTSGPVFGQDDLRVTFDNKSIPLYGVSYIGHAYDLPQGYNNTDQVDGTGLFAETSIFTWDDLEVFYYNGELKSIRSITLLESCLFLNEILRLFKALNN